MRAGMTTGGREVSTGTDIADALADWVTLHDEAERIHAALPEATKAAIEASGADISGLTTWLASLPVAERLKLRGFTEHLATMVAVDQAVSPQGSQRCLVHRPQLRSDG